jgi:hypothetical protein
MLLSTVSARATDEAYSRLLLKLTLGRKEMMLLKKSDPEPIFLE